MRIAGHVVLLLACSLASGCEMYPVDPPPVLADDDARYAKMLGLGNEYEVTRRIQVLRGEHADRLRTERQMPEPHLGLIRGYLEPGTRLRVIHAWRVSGDDATEIGGAFAMLRQVPDHRPWPFAFTPGESRNGWTITAAGATNVYVLNPDFVRLVPPEQRTPDEAITKLTRKQEWPTWRSTD